MKKTMLTTFAVLAFSTFAFAESTVTTTRSNTDNALPDSATVDSNHESTNSNDRFNNRDTRTNSDATPATVGKENSKLGSDVHTNVRNGTHFTPSSEVPVAPTAVGTAGSDDTGYRTQNNRLDKSSKATSTVHHRVAHKKTHTSHTVAANHHNKRIHRHNHLNKAANKSETTSSVETRRLNTTGSSTANSAAAGAAGVAAGSAYNTNRTAQDQGTAERELETTRQIRSQITDNKDLSVSAHNIKIITENGRVLLKGPVQTDSEKSQVESIAKRVAGNTAVINETYVEKK